MEFVFISTLLCLIIATNPAVTNVELCTKAEVGVGALIAFGSHPLKGSCALLVKLNNTKNNLSREYKLERLK